MNVEVSTTSGFRCYSGLFAKSPLSLSQDQFSRCRASWQELAGVVVFSAIPFTAVKAIANSPLGETLQRRMQEKKQVALQNASLYKVLAENAKKDSFWYGEERPRWLGPIPFDYPTYLDGDLPGDYGFDIAGLSQDPVAFKRYYNFEILHARWAMLAALGALIPELLDLVGAFHFVEPVWWRVGYSKLQGNECEYRHSDIARVNPRDCWYWLNGNCLNPKCGFRHPPLDGLLGAEASTSVGPAAPQAPIKQGVACIFFQKGYCLKGHLCPFLHGPPNTVNNVAVQPIPPKPVTKPSKVDPAGPKKHIQEQKPTQYGTVQKPVESLPPQGKQAPKVPLRNGNGVATEKKVAPPPVMNEFQSNHGVYETNHVSDNEEINGNDVEEYSREPTPGFDVLVENDVDDSEYYPNEEQFRRSVDYDVDRDMYPKKRDFERYNEEEYAWEDRRDNSKFGRKRFTRDESPNQFDHSDLRHRLSKQRGDNVGGLRPVISREHPRDHHNDRRVGSGPLSSRLRGRIRIPGRSTSPGYENGSRVEREIYMRRQQRSRYSPERPRFRDRIRGRSSDDFNNQGREYRGYRGNSSEFTGPKRLSELRSQQVDDGQTLGKRKYPRPESQQSEVNASFEGPKPLSEILKWKRGSVISSTNNEDNQKEIKEIPSGNTDNEKPANGQSFTDHEPSDAEYKVGSVDEDALLDEELEAYDHKDAADYEYEQIDGEDYNMEEDESEKKESEVYS